MKQFTYTIRDPLGVHARPAGLIARMAKEFTDTVITIARGDDAVRATQLMKLMGMGIRQGDQVTVTADGISEEKAVDALKGFFQEHL